MVWYALRAAGESVTATRHLLAGAAPATWGRLAVLVLFAGGLTTPFLVDFNRGPALLDGVPWGDRPSLVLLLAGVAFVGLALLLVGAIAEFVLLEALRGNRIGLVARGRRWWRAGVQLFAFRVAVFAFLALAVAAALRAGNPGPGLGSTLVIVLLALLALVLVVLDRLTVAFVVPIMFVDGRSLPDGWRAFLPTLEGQWRQYAAYLLVVGAIGAAVAVLGGVLAALFAVAFAVPFSAFGSAVAAVLVDQGLSVTTVPRVVAAVLALPYLAVVLGCVLLVHVAPVAYLRYIALFVLGDTAAEYDPIPRVRAAVRRR